MSELLNNILRLGSKYGPEVSQYLSGQKRISQAIEDQENEQFPDLARDRATSSGQFLSNRVGENLLAPQEERAERQFTEAVGQAGRSKGGIRNLASLLRSSGDVQERLGAANSRAQVASAVAASPMERAIQRYNMGVSDEKEMYDLMKGRSINALEDQGQRMKGRMGKTAFDALTDISSLFNRSDNTDNTDGPDNISIRPPTQIENPGLEKKLVGSSQPLDIAALQNDREYGDKKAAANRLMDQLNIDLSPQGLKPFPREDGSVGSGVRRRPGIGDMTEKDIVSLLRDQVGPRASVSENSEDGLVGSGLNPGGFTGLNPKIDFNNPNLRALFKLLRQ